MSRGAPLFPILPHRLGGHVADALGDAQLQQFVGATTRLKERARETALAAAFGADVDALRRLAGAIKQHTLAHLDVYLERFVDAAEALGTQVHFAGDAAEARSLCVQIAREEGVLSCVKAKSMVTEEIQLREALEDAGIETLETDLGELVLQLDGDAPSHIVTPMIHKDRRAAGRAFERALGTPFTADPAALTALARAHVRDAVDRAELGVTGGNFLVADSGALVLCTNEGNARWCTTAPRVHVAVVGIEKLVPTMADLTLMLKLLARSSTGQPLTVYTTILHGPRRADEADGPEVQHIVLLDHGRSAVLADPTLRPALGCVRCGACLNTCPVYRKVGGHAYGSVYPGPIGAVLTPALRGVTNYPDLPQATSLCGACRRVCPVDIDLPGMLVALRGRGVAAGTTGWRSRWAHRLWAWSLGGPLRYRVATWVARRWLRSRAGAAGMVTRGVGPLAGWTRARPLPAPAARSFLAFWRRAQRRRRAGVASEADEA